MNRSLKRRGAVEIDMGSFLYVTAGFLFAVLVSGGLWYFLANSKPSDPPLKGHWQFQPQMGSSMQGIGFEADHAFRWSWTPDWVENYPGTWSLNGNMLTLNIPKGKWPDGADIQGTVIIRKIDGSSLELQSGSKVYSLTKRPW